MVGVIIKFKENSKYVTEEINPLVCIRCEDDKIIITNDYYDYVYPLNEIENISFKEVVEENMKK